MNSERTFGFSRMLLSRLLSSRTPHAMSLSCFLVRSRDCSASCADREGASWPSMSLQDITECSISLRHACSSN